MEVMFFVGIIVGMSSRIIMLNLDQKQYPTQPNVLLTQIVLAFVASSLGSLLVPALIERSYSSITFLSLAAEQFRQVRSSRRDALHNLEEVQLVKRGDDFIEEIARTYEVRNYMCIITSCVTVGVFHILTAEFGVGELVGQIIGGSSGIILALILRKLLTRKSIGEIADVKIVDITFVNDCIMKIGELKGITNVGLESDRNIYLTRGIGIEIIPKDNSYDNAGILYDSGQRQTIIYNIYSRLDIYRQNDEPAFYPLPRRNPIKESLMIAYVPMEKDIDKLIDAVKSTPILSSATGKNLALKNYKIGKKGST